MREITYGPGGYSPDVPNVVGETEVDDPAPVPGLAALAASVTTLDATVTTLDETVAVIAAEILGGA